MEADGEEGVNAVQWMTRTLTHCPVGQNPSDIKRDKRDGHAV